MRIVVIAEQKGQKTMSADHLDTDDRKGGFVVVPSNVYNNNVLNIMTEAATHYDNISVSVSRNIVSELGYVISYVIPHNSVNMDPFATVEPVVKWERQYNPDVERVRKEAPFFGVDRKQVFFSEDEYDEHFDSIRENVYDVIERMIRNYAEGDDEK